MRETPVDSLVGVGDSYVPVQTAALFTTTQTNLEILMQTFRFQALTECLSATHQLRQQK